MKEHIAIVGAGNLGTALADGLVGAGAVTPEQVTLVRRRIELLEGYGQRGFGLSTDPAEALGKAEVVLLAVEPQQLAGVAAELRPALNPGRHLVVSVVSGTSIRQLAELLGDRVQIVRAMPNTAVSVRESMTCLAAADRGSRAAGVAEELFNAVGRTLFVEEGLMVAATALGACGVAFFLRAIRAASQGGIEIGFRAEDALAIAAQTAKGAASLLVEAENHPEKEIDRVTTPRGCTIAGLNRMEHEGFSSAMIRGITVSAENAEKLFSKD